MEETMAIGPVELNGTISRMQDYSTIKQNEDNHGILNQQNFQSRFEKEIENRHKQVTKGDDINKEEKKFDAREKGAGEYYGNGGRRRKKEENEGGKVIVKGQSSFDMKI